MLQSPTTSSWLRVSPLEVLITRACDPSLHEPNYAVHLEVAEYINSKKANNPREAAMTIARLSNNRNPHISMLSLALLDTLVQSCGYPFHLQISTKEFLNELVRRFPERPPPYPNAVMSRILELINGWKEGICQDSRWKEDLGNIRDMWRLLSFKGYRFRDFGGASASQRVESGVATAANLKTAEELEEEDREAQSAKLQELIRRGTPRDLAAAQELMKSLSGANPDAKPDYRTQALTEINKLESKVILLNEMLDNVDTERGERFAKGDAYDQVASILNAARPKLQKWVGEANMDADGSGDSESLDTFLQMNDQINTVLNRYEAFKKGDYVAAANPIPSELSNASGSAGVGGLSLIDFDDSSAGSGTNGGATSHGAGTGQGAGGDDLMGIFGSPQNSAMPVMDSRIGFGLPGMNVGTSTPPIPNYAAPSPMLGNSNGNGLFANNNNPLRAASMSPPQATGTPPASIMLPSTPTLRNNTGSPASFHNNSSFNASSAPNYHQPQMQGQTPNYTPNYFGAPANAQGPVRMNSGSGMGTGTPIGGMSGMGSMTTQGMGMPSMVTNMSGTGAGMGAGGQRQAQATQQPQQPQAQGKDPFADLAGLF